MRRICLKRGHALLNPNRTLLDDSIEYGYKFTSGNVGVVGKKITLPHYMSMFLKPVSAEG